MKKSAQNFSFMRPKEVSKGFTLVELLVVIAIIAILAAVVVLIINPVELTKRGRDATRLSDLATLQNAITVAAQENASTTNFLCDQAAGTPPCTGSSTDAGASAADGSGWVKIDLGAQPAVKVAALPVDPTNNATYYYSYASDGDDWEINAVLESTQYATTEDKDAKDGGDDGAVYEVGSKLDLI